MIAIEELSKDLMTWDDFLDWYPDGYGRYELRNGEVFEMQPTGTHEQVAGFIAGEIFAEIRRLQLSYSIPRQAFIKPINTDRTCYIPDLIVLDNQALKNELLWKKRSTISQGKTVKLIVEVVSNNWRNDYGHKLVDYEELAIPEYWIVDYLAIGGKRYIGDPKQPTISIYQLVDGEYQLKQFRGEETIISQTFPELKIKANQILAVGD